MCQLFQDNTVYTENVDQTYEDSLKRIKRQLYAEQHIRFNAE